jgi:competence protein ComEC
MELEGEEILVKKYNMDADVLKVGHHGSITSSTEELIKEVSPDIAIISVGDRFDSLPSNEVLNRLNESTVYITKEDGGIRLSIDKSENIKVKTAR